MSKVISWSFSALQSFETCPYAHNEIKLTKRVKEIWGKEAQAGTEIHKRLEERLLSGKPLTGMDAAYEPLCQKIEQAAGDLHPEMSYCITKDFRLTKYNDWDNVWLRAIIDVLKVNGHKALILDWKTGKEKNDYDQLDLFACVVFFLYPEVTEVKGGYVWLKTGKMSPLQTYHRDDIGVLWEGFMQRVEKRERAIKTNNFPTKTSGLCKNHCAVKKAGRCPEFQGEVK